MHAVADYDSRRSIRLLMRDATILPEVNPALDGQRG
jgi:hypothetical protein